MDLGLRAWGRPPLCKQGVGVKGPVGQQQRKDTLTCQETKDSGQPGRSAIPRVGTQPRETDTFVHTQRSLQAAAGLPVAGNPDSAAAEGGIGKMGSGPPGGVVFGHKME